ncbi:head-tail joining protein [Oceaniradius stylonematis]|uniref:head-tail joining protein n=1 Tax=Oceaniradius stylonematis TaxID=2184161 RepID=UPI003B5CBEEE
MPVESASDRAAFVSVDDFGATGQVLVDGHAPIALNGIFDEGYSLVGDIDDTEGMSSAEPTLTVRTADLPTSLERARLALTVDGVARLFDIVEPKPDGTGMTELRLFESS